MCHQRHHGESQQQPYEQPAANFKYLKQLVTCETNFGPATGDKKDAYSFATRRNQHGQDSSCMDTMD